MKTYIQPCIEVVRLDAKQSLMTGSVTADGAVEIKYGGTTENSNILVAGSRRTVWDDDDEEEE